METSAFDAGVKLNRDVWERAKRPEGENGVSAAELQTGALMAIGCFLEVLASPPVEDHALDPDADLKQSLLRMLSERDQKVRELEADLKSAHERNVNWKKKFNARVTAHEQSMARETHWHQEYEALKKATSPDGLKERLEVIVKAEALQREARAHLEKEVKAVVDFFEGFVLEDQQSLKETLRANSRRWSGDTQGDGDWYSEEDETAPFISEAVLYTLVGKEDARTILSVMTRLKNALENHMRVGENRDPRPVAWGLDI